jgi:maltooligosyltrehalose trehalohydrolase
MNFNQVPVTFSPVFPDGNWRKILDSSEPKWLGNGSSMPDQLTSQGNLIIPGHSVALYQINH